MAEEKSHSNSTRVAKNTILLYIRMLVLLVIGLFTSRVVLNSLGVENYGINSVIAGFLSMFGIITTALSTAINRYISVELGRRNIEKLKSVFTTSVVVQFFMGLLVVLLIESFGLWFLNNEMQIPDGRHDAAMWCLHCATMTTFISLIDVPFNSLIIAHEKMSAFAYMGILDATLKLGICYLLYISPFDKLKTYSILLVMVYVLTTSIYWIYCQSKFEECTFERKVDKSLLRMMWGFAGWNLFGQASWIMNTQGINILMNIFFGVAVNAARGVAVQVNGIIQQFVNNFMLAMYPQITKSYAAGDKTQAFALACRGAKFSFYIMFFLSLPLMIESKQILKLWLGNPPEDTVVFVIWTIISTYTIILGNTLVTLQVADGHIKKYQLWMTILGSIPFPLTWVLFKCGCTVISSYYIYVVTYWGLIFVRWYLVNEMTGLPAKQYLFGVVGKCHIIAILSCVLPLLEFYLLPEVYIRIVIIGLTSIGSTGTAIYFFGLDKNEKEFFNIKARLLYSKFRY